MNSLSLELWKLSASPEQIQRVATEGRWSGSPEQGLLSPAVLALSVLCFGVSFGSNTLLSRQLRNCGSVPSLLPTGVNIDKDSS